MSNWIPCSERLPSLGQQVLTFRLNPVQICLVYRTLCIGQPLGGQWFWLENEGMTYRAEEMTHWQPAPKRPPLTLDLKGTV